MPSMNLDEYYNEIEASISNVYLVVEAIGDYSKIVHKGTMKECKPIFEEQLPRVQEGAESCPNEGIDGYYIISVEEFCKIADDLVPTH